MRVLLDTYGSDNGVNEIVKGAVLSLRSRDDHEIVLFGDKDEIIKGFNDMDFSDYSLMEESKNTRAIIVHSNDFITNRDNPVEIFRGRNDSSMAMALDYLKANDNAHGLISAGNTGALMVGSISRVGLKKGLSSPVLCSHIPNPYTNWTLIVDCGSHLSPDTNDLIAFARLGSDFYKATFKTDNPRIALLSVGTESSKGNALVKSTYEKLKESDLNFIGNVEGNDIQNGKADVVVTDGFAGNVLLKSIESSGLLAANMIKDYLSSSDLSKEQKDIVNDIYMKVHTLFDLSSEGAATFLGTNKLILKMHGCANSRTVVACVDQLLRTTPY